MFFYPFFYPQRPCWETLTGSYALTKCSWKYATLEALSLQWCLVSGTHDKLCSLERSDLTGWCQLIHCGMYSGAWPVRARFVNRRILSSTRTAMGSQCIFISSGVAWLPSSVLSESSYVCFRGSQWCIVLSTVSLPVCMTSSVQISRH